MWKNLIDSVNRNVLKWFGHMECMSEEWLARKVYESEVEGRKNRGMLYMKWVNGVEKLCIAMSLELRDAKVKCMDRKQWRDFGNDTSCGVSV